MAELFRAFFFKLRKDLTFRVTLIVGAGVAILMMLLYMLIDGDGPHRMCTGNNLFIGSFNPVQNFGLAIPINLITFTVLEFSSGIIRNKIIAGNSKVKIYLSLFLTGLVFTLLLLFTYVGLATLLGTIVGGFDPNGFALLGIASSNYSSYLTPDFIYKFFIVSIFVYMTITAFTIFFSTLFRNVGPCIPICIIVPLILCTVMPIIAVIPDVKEALGEAPLYLNPFHVIGNPSLVPHYRSGEDWPYMNTYMISNYEIVVTVCSNLVWTGLFVGFGTLFFVRRDVR